MGLGLRLLVVLLGLMMDDWICVQWNGGYGWISSCG